MHEHVRWEWVAMRSMEIFRHENDTWGIEPNVSLRTLVKPLRTISNRMPHSSTLDIRVSYISQPGSGRTPTCFYCVRIPGCTIWPERLHKVSSVYVCRNYRIDLKVTRGTGQARWIKQGTMWGLKRERPPCTVCWVWRPPLRSAGSSIYR